MKKENKTNWKPDEIEYIKSCFVGGRRLKTNRMIADRLKRGASEVKAIVKRLKLAEGIPNVLSGKRQSHKKGIPFIEIGANQCRAIISDEGQPCVFCGKKTVTGFSYCNDHKKIFHVPFKKRQPIQIPANVT